MRMMHLHSESTPNPLCRSFSIPSTAYDNFIPDGQSCEVTHRGLSRIHPLAAGLFDQYAQEVSSLFLAPRKASVTVYSHIRWENIEWSMSSFFGHYLVMNNACVAPAKEYILPEDDLKILDDDSEVIQCIKELLREQVRPMIQRDGGDVKLLEFDESSGIVKLALLGACRTCPSSQNTLKEGIERMMKHFLPEVKEVREDKNHSFFQEYGLMFNSEKELYQEAARIDRERKRHLKTHLTGSLLSFDALNEPDGD